MSMHVESAQSSAASHGAIAADQPRAAHEPWWRESGRRYYAYNAFLRRTFGRRVHKVTLDAGFTCPNVDGTLAVGGCVYCDNRSFSPNRRLPAAAIREQLDRGIEILSRPAGTDRFIAYF